MSVNLFAVTNPLYLQSNRFNDITVVILRDSASTAPARIATTAELDSAKETTLAGFGNNDTASTKGIGIKREVEVDIIALRRSPQYHLSSAESHYGFHSKVEFVAGGEGHDSCNGDSGGPAYISVEAAKQWSPEF